MPMRDGAAANREPGRRIDYLLVRCDRHGSTLAVTGCDRFRDRPVRGVWAGDHFGVTAELTPPPAGATGSVSKRART